MWSHEQNPGFHASQDDFGVWFYSGYIHVYVQLKQSMHCFGGLNHPQITSQRLNDPRKVRLLHVGQGLLLAPGIEPSTKDARQKLRYLVTSGTETL